MSSNDFESWTSCEHPFSLLCHLNPNFYCYRSMLIFTKKVYFDVTNSVPFTTITFCHTANKIVGISLVV